MCKSKYVKIWNDCAKEREREKERIEKKEKAREQEKVKKCRRIGS